MTLLQFITDTPNGNWDSGNPYTVATRVKFSSDIIVNNLAWYKYLGTGFGKNSAGFPRIYRYSDGVLVGKGSSATPILDASTNVWSEDTPLDSPVTLTANTEYLIGFWFSSGTPIGTKTTTAGHTHISNGITMTVVTQGIWSASDTKPTSTTTAEFYMKINAETVTQSGTAYTKSLTESIALSEIFTKQTSRFKSISESVTLSESVTKMFSGFKTITDSISSSDSASRSYGAIRNFNDTIPSSDTISKRFSAVVVDSVATGDSEYDKTAKSFSDVVVGTDSLSSTKGKAVNLSDSVAITDSIRKALSKLQVDSIFGSDSGSEASTKKLFDTITQSDTLTVTGGKAVLLTDTVSLTDAISKAIQQAKVDTATISENFGKQSAQSVKVYDVIVSTDHIDTFLPNVPIYSEVIQLTLNISQTRTVNIAIAQRDAINIDVTQQSEINLDVIQRENVGIDVKQRKQIDLDI